MTDTEAIWGYFWDNLVFSTSDASTTFPSHGMIHSDCSGKYFNHTIMWPLRVQLHWSDGVILDFHLSTKGKGQPLYPPGVTPWYSRSTQDSEAGVPTLE